MNLLVSYEQEIALLVNRNPRNSLRTLIREVLNLLATDFFFQILAHPLFEM